VCVCPDCCRGNVGLVINQKDQRGVKEELLRDLDLNQVLDRDVEHLSGV
jgi:translation initiation factor RLI1